MKILVVGAGFYGAVCARELHDYGHEVLVIERHDHVAGHCYTRTEPATGCIEHVYGPHIFHTDNEAVWRYISRFGTFNNFVNRPKVRYRNRLYSFPINLLTLNQVFGVVTPREAAERLEQERVPAANPANMEEWCLANFGPTLYELFVRGYTQKQWGRPPRELPASIIKRVPIRLDCDDRYFTDRWQGIPCGGYTAIVTALLRDIPVRRSTDLLKQRDELIAAHDLVINSGAIDEFFGHDIGPLEYRTLRFERKVFACADYQGNAVVNCTDIDVPYTRVVEHKHFDGSSGDRTLVTFEYPQAWRRGLEPFYPVGTRANLARLAAYQDRARWNWPKVIFGGRLGGYRYMDMHDVIAAALQQAADINARSHGQAVAVAGVA